MKEAWGCPFFIRTKGFFQHHGKKSIAVAAGLLTAPPFKCLPDPHFAIQWQAGNRFKGFFSKMKKRDHSGGSVMEFHHLPFSIIRLPEHSGT